MNEASDQFAARLAEDLERILGTGIMIDRLDLGAGEDDPARIRAICLFDGATEVLEAEGRTRLEAYSALVNAASALRLAIASRNNIAPI